MSGALRVLRSTPGEQDEPAAWRAFRLDVIRQTPMPDIGHYGEPYPAVNGVVLTQDQHRTLSSITSTFAGIFEKAVDALCRDTALLERYGFPWVATELLVREAAGPLALGRFDFMLDRERGWQLLEYNADTPSGPRETVVVEALIARYLGWCGAGLRRSGTLLSEAIARVFGDTVAATGVGSGTLTGPSAGLSRGAQRTVGIMTDAGYAEDLAQTFFLARLLEGPLSKRGVDVVYGDVDNLSVRRGRLYLCDRTLHALYRYYPFEWLLGQQAFVDLFESISDGKLRLLNGLRGLLAQNKGVIAWIWEHRDDRAVFSSEERRVIAAHLPPTHWIGEMPADPGELVLKQVFGREGEEVYFGDAISAADWEKCRAWGSYVVQRRVRAAPVRAVIMTSSGPEVRDLWPVVGSFTAAGKWAGYYTRAGEPITTGHAKFIGTFWERESATMPGPTRRTARAAE